MMMMMMMMHRVSWLPGPSAFHCTLIVSYLRLRGEGLVWLIGAIVCLLATPVGPIVQTFTRVFAHRCIHSSTHLFVCEHNIVKMNEPVLMQIGTSGPWGKGMICSTFGVRRLKLRLPKTKIG